MKKSFILGAGCLLGLLVIFMTTNPNKLPAIVLLVPFVVLLVSVVSFFKATLVFLGQGKSRAGYTAWLLAVPLILLLALQSLGQLTPRDFLGIGAFIVVFFFYVQRFSVSLTQR